MIDNHHIVAFFGEFLGQIVSDFTGADDDDIHV
jgi:hypothetical protein